MLSKVFNVTCYACRKEAFIAVRVGVGEGVRSFIEEKILRYTSKSCSGRTGESSVPSGPIHSLSGLVPALINIILSVFS